MDLSKIPALGAQGKDVQGLLKNSVTLLGKDKDIILPTVYTTLFQSIRTIILFVMLHSFIVSKSIGIGSLCIFLLIISAPILSFVRTRYQAITSYMIYEVLQGIDTNIKNAKEKMAGTGKTIFAIALVEYLISQNSTNTEKKEGGIVGMLKGMFLAIFVEVWDLIKNFSVPAIVIDKCSFKEIPEKLKQLKKNVPAVLVGVLGIDLIGSTFVSLFGFIILPALFISFAGGFFLADLLPKSFMVNIPLGDPVKINLCLAFIFLPIASIIFSFLNNITDLTKTSYFTTLYTALTSPTVITEGLREEVAHFLNYGDRLEGYSFFSNVEKGHDLDPETGEDEELIRKISYTFAKNVDKGMEEEKIARALVKKGYTKAQVKLGHKHYKADKMV